MTSIQLVWHRDLTDEQIARLRALFDAEYRDEQGWWDPDQPYGYSPAELHVIATDGPAIAGHVGMQRRTIGVGDREVVVAGTGGVLVSPSTRDGGLGRKLLDRAQQATRTLAPAQFGYLGCRDEIVPFYRACGWTPIDTAQHHRSRLDPSRAVSSTGPQLIRSGTDDVDAWPVGAVDLRGTPW